MTTQKKNTIKILAGNQELSTQKEMYQYLTDNGNAFFTKEMGEKGYVYKLSSSSNKSAIAANALYAEVTRHFDADVTFTTPVGKSAALTPENFLEAVVEVVEAITFADGNEEWVDKLIDQLQSSGQLTYKTELLNSLVKLHHSGGENATPEDKSEIISKYLRREYNLVEDLTKIRKVANATNVANVMDGLKLVYFNQGPKGGFTARSKDKGTVAHYSNIPVTIETVDGEGVPVKITACTVTFTTPGEVTEKRLNRKKLTTAPPPEYVRCESNGQVSARHERVIYSELSDLAKRKTTTKAAPAGNGITVQVKGVKKTRKVSEKDAAATAAAEADAHRVHNLAYDIVKKYDPNFMDKLFKLGKKCDTFMEVTKAFDALSTSQRGGLVYNKLSKADIETLERLAR